MSRKLTITDINEALERASRIPAYGTREEQAGLITDEATPDPTNEQGSTGDELVVYQSKRGLRLSLRFRGDTLWMTQRQMADLFGVGVPAINKHLSNIFVEGELDPRSSISRMEIVADDRKRRTVQVYNLDAVISVGYRVSSKQATTFRVWATSVLLEYARKGYALDDERLKDPADDDYFAELRERLRDIRASEANVYKELRSILMLCSDYDPQSQASQNFYAFIQNKLFWTTASMTAPEIIVNRADANRPNLGLSMWPKKEIRQTDALVAKNYLAEAEIKELNRLTTMLLDFFEDRISRRERVSTSDLEQALDGFLGLNERSILRYRGSVSRAAADEHAKREYRKFAALRRIARQALE